MSSGFQYNDYLPPTQSRKFLQTKYSISTSVALDTLDTGVRYFQQALSRSDVENPSARFVNSGMELIYAKRQALNGSKSAFMKSLLLDLRLNFSELTPKPECKINRLPVELLREVFIYCMPDREWRLDKSAPPQLVISHVCSHWRNVALCYPRLWSTFMIVFPIPRHIPMVQLWLERSGKHPLNLYIHHCEGIHWIEEYTLTVTNALIDLLRPHMHRWRLVTLRLAAGVQSSLLALPRESLPSLEILHFEQDWSCNSWDPDSLRLLEEPFFSSSSNSSLKQVTWETRFHLGMNLGSSLPTQLTHLCASFGVDSLHFRSLPQLQNLQVLRLHSGSAKDATSLQNSVTLSYLHTLEVQSRAFTSNLLNSLNTPNLQVLAIRASLTEEVRRALSLFIARSRCSLKALSCFEPGVIEGCQFWEELFSSPYLSTLVELNVLSLYAGINSLLETLVDENPLPLLKRIWLATNECSTGLLLNVMKRRKDNFILDTGPMMSRSLFNSMEPVLYNLHSYFPTPPSGCSVCIQVLNFSRSDVELLSHNHVILDITELDQWVEANTYAHWKMVLPGRD